jgi:hypothetical protein
MILEIDSLKSEKLRNRLDLIKKLSLVIKETSRCVLGQSSLNLLLSYIRGIEDGKYRTFY